MISKIITALSLLILLPIAVSGDESLLKQAVAKQKKFAAATQFHSLKCEPQRQFASFTIQNVPHLAILETTNTKSGTITYLAIFDLSLKTVHFAIASYQNGQNGSLAMPGFLNQFKNKQPASKPIKRGNGVDAISGATMSTESLISALNRSTVDLKKMVD